MLLFSCAIIEQEHYSQVSNDIEKAQKCIQKMSPEEAHSSKDDYIKR